MGFTVDVNPFILYSEKFFLVGKETGHFFTS